MQSNAMQRWKWERKKSESYRLAGENHEVHGFLGNIHSLMSLLRPPHYILISPTNGIPVDIGYENR